MYFGYRKVKPKHGKVHDYLRMTFNLSDKNKVNIYIIDYMNAMVNNFTTKLKPNNIIPEPATGYFFAVGKINKLREYKHQELHTVVT